MVADRVHVFSKDLFCNLESKSENTELKFMAPFQHQQGSNPFSPTLAPRPNVRNRCVCPWKGPPRRWISHSRPQILRDCGVDLIPVLFCRVTRAYSWRHRRKFPTVHQRRLEVLRQPRRQHRCRVRHRLQALPAQRLTRPPQPIDRHRKQVCPSRVEKYPSSCHGIEWSGGHRFFAEDGP